MKLISWNVNGFRAVLKKGFDEYFKQADADIFCIQESKMQEGQANFNPEGYESFYNSAVKKGYSGTIVFTRNTPINVSKGLNGAHDDEGRVLTLEYDNFYFVDCYVPNSQSKLKRLDYRMEFENDMREYLCGLDKIKPVIYCGDLNVAHKEIDLKNPEANVANPGFSPQEREKMTQLLNSGFTDSFRYLYPDKTDAYSWWSYRTAARNRNAGWRIDYFIVSDRIQQKINDSIICDDIMGSDHCPVQLDISI